MLSSLYQAIHSVFRNNPALELPLLFQTKKNIKKIFKMGPHSHHFVQKINNLLSKYPNLVTEQNFDIFLSAYQHIDSVADAFEVIYENQPQLATSSTLKHLAALGLHARDYTAVALTSYKNLPGLFPVASGLKELKHIGILSPDNGASHIVYTKEKNRHGGLYGVKKEENHKQWVCKTVSPASLENSQDISDEVSIQNLIRSRYHTHPKRVPLEEFMGRSISMTDKDAIKAEVFSTIAEALSSDAQAQTISSQKELLVFFDKKMMQPPYANAWFKAYVESAEIIYEKIEYLVSLLSEDRNINNDLILRELQEASLFPMKRAVFLKESAHAQIEVVAQELRRALCPLDVIGRNPFPKYRLGTPNTADHRTIKIIPDIPETYIMSERINFQYDLYAQPGKITFSYHDNNSSRYRFRRKPSVNIEDIPGLGTVSFFAKFLGDCDAKISNIGISVDENSRVDYAFTALDSGNCFSRPIGSSALFETPLEIRQNPHTSSDSSYNFLYSKFSGKNFRRKSSGQLEDFSDLLSDISKNPNVIQETMACAFNTAFLPPESYQLFTQQYLNPDNHFVAEYFWRVVVDEHLLKEQQALYTLFENDPSFLNYFLESNNPHNNIFHRYAQLVTQTESFCFYKKHRMKHDLSFQKNPLMIEDYFISFLEKKYHSGTPELRTLIQNAFHSWDITLVKSAPGMDSISSLERAHDLKEKISRVFDLKRNSPVLLLSESESSSTRTKYSASL